MPPKKGICRHLEAGDSRGQYNQRDQKQWERRSAGGGHEQKGARAHGEQAHHHRALIANPVDNPRRRYREKKVCSKKGKLDQHDLFVIQVEDGLQMGDKNVIQASQESPHKKQRGYYRQWSSIRR
jgi:hypothetical protein